MDGCSSRFYLPRLASQGEEYKLFQFGAGESHFQILAQTPRHVEIMFRYTGDQSIIQLLLLNDALKRQGAEVIDLYIPYFPGARQDRVCNRGEALSVKVYADLINQQNFNQVFIFDPHSDVTAALLNKAIGKQLICVFVDNGLLRLNEAEQVMNTFKNDLGINVIKVEAEAVFYEALMGVSDPENKRKIIGKTFIDIFEREAATLEPIRHTRDRELDAKKTFNFRDCGLGSWYIASG